MALWTVITGMSSVVLMQEQMHQQARRKKQEGQNAKKMRAMFGKEEKGGDSEKSNYNPFPLRTMLILGLSMHTFQLMVYVSKLELCIHTK
jgi:hypothetical protein